MTMKEFQEFWFAVHELFGMNPQTEIRVKAFTRSYDLVEHVPVEALQFARRRIEDRDDLPKNMAKFVLHSWHEWKVSPGNGEGAGHALNLPPVDEAQRQRGQAWCQKILRDFCNNIKRVPTR